MLPKNWKKIGKILSDYYQNYETGSKNTPVVLNNIIDVDNYFARLVLGIKKKTQED